MNSANAAASIDATDQLVDVDRNWTSSILAMGVRPKARSSLLS